MRAEKKKGIHYSSKFFLVIHFEIQTKAIITCFLAKVRNKLKPLITF